MRGPLKKGGRGANIL